MTEEWRPVVGFEGFYEVSSIGRIRSVDRVIPYRDGRKPKRFPGKVLAQMINAKGYPALQLKACGRIRGRTVHILVCEAFHGSRPSPDHEVRHLNGDPADNRVENLAWGTRAENAQDSLRHGTNWQASKTRCPEGHPYDEENTRRTASGRMCRECKRLAGRAAYRDDPAKVNARAIQWAKEHRDLLNARDRERYRKENPDVQPRGPYSKSDTHCKNGHPRTEANTYISKRGYRNCRVCHRDYQRELKRRQQEPA